MVDAEHLAEQSRYHRAELLKRMITVEELMLNDIKHFSKTYIQGAVGLAFIWILIVPISWILFGGILHPINDGLITTLYLWVFWDTRRKYISNEEFKVQLEKGIDDKRAHLKEIENEQ